MHVRVEVREIPEGLHEQDQARAAPTRAATEPRSVTDRPFGRFIIADREKTNRAKEEDWKHRSTAPVVFLGARRARPS